MKYYKNHLLHALFVFGLLCLQFNSDAQCNCQQGEYSNNCEEEKLITAGSNGSNITNELYEAVMNYCRIRLVNYSNDEQVYFTFPQVFRGINHKEIILDPGVRLIGLPGAFSDCSQSVLTFDGNSVHDIIFKGDYCEGQLKPSIEMGETNYISYDNEGLLVGVDDSGDPYLDDLGQPNYVFSDGDNDPYFDNNGIPNFIGNGNQPPVLKDCEYNDFLCNRKIVVWCPNSWEARHIISLHGVQNFWVEDLDIANASGGDGIHITDDRDFNVSNEVSLSNIDFRTNARNGLKITNASCIDLDNLDFYNNGMLAPANLVTPEAALNIDQNTSPGSIDDYLGMLPNYALNNISLEFGYFDSNVFRDISIDIPISLTSCSEEASFKAENVCISNSTDGIVFESSNESQAGIIKLNSVSLDEFDNALVVSNDWQSSAMTIGTDDWSVNKTGSGQVSAFDINSPAFCSSTTVSDICKSNNITDNLCQPANCVSPSYFCSPNQDPTCGGGGGVNCDYDIYTEVEEVLDCDCDYLFMVDESGSVENDDWDAMYCSISNIMGSLDEMCVDSCDVRFSVIQWSGPGEQRLTSNFDCSPFDFNRWFHNGNTDVGDAINYLWDLLNMGEELQPNSECFKVIIFTDAPCHDSSEWANAADHADIMKKFLNVEFIVIDYTPDGELADCEEVIDVIDDENSNADPNDIIQSEFDCETGVGVDDISTSSTYTISIVIDPSCIDPMITWTAYGGGQILTTSPDQTTVSVNGKGYYTVEVLCESGCTNYIFEYVYFNTSSKSSNKGNQVAIVKKDRTRYYDGKSYTPHEFEQFMIREHEIPVVDIQISPNPFIDVLNIQLPENDVEYTLTIFNTQGQVIHNSNIKQDQPIQVELEEKTDGLYIVKLLNKNTLKITSHKVLKLSKE